MMQIKKDFKSSEKWVVFNFDLYLLKPALAGVELYKFYQKDMSLIYIFHNNEALKWARIIHHSISFPSVHVNFSTFQIGCWENPLWYSWPWQPGKQGIVGLLDIFATSAATFGSSMLPRVKNPWLIVGNGSTITSKPW